MSPDYRERLLRREHYGHTIFLVGLIVLTAFTAFFAADAYVPSLPQMAKALKIDTSRAQLTITTYIFGMTSAILLYGSFSEKYGRRKMTLLGLAVTIVGSLLCFVAPNIQTLMIGRFIQGCGTAAGMGLSRSMIRDLFSGEEIARMMSTLAMVFSIAPSLAPTIGGYLQHYFGWRANFIFITIYATIFFVLCRLFLPETNPELNPKALQLRVLIQTYREILTNRIFLTSVFCSSVGMSGIIAYYAMTPFLMQDVMGLSALEYGWYAGLIAVAIILSRLLNHLLISRYSLFSLVHIGNILMLLGGSLMLIFGLFGVMNLTVIIIPMMIFILGTGPLFPNAMVLGMHPFPHISGTSGALYGCLQIFGTLIASIFAASLPELTQVPLAALLTVMSLLSLLSFYLLVMKQAEPI